jgi:glycosyltransferase involved in cell wall biosynthesis
MELQQERLLTILIPVYNAEKYLVRCLDSIVKQKEFGSLVDLVVINDGSNDKSLSIILDYARENPCIKVLNQDNKGIGPSRNTLIYNADGRYFWFVDADDYVEKSSLSIITQSLLQDDCDMLLLGYNWIVGENVRKITYKKTFESGFDMSASGVYQNSLWIRVIKKSIIKSHGIRFQPYIMGEDFDFLFRLLPYLHFIKCIELPLYNYVFNPKSAVGNADLCHKKKVVEDSLRCIETNMAFWDRFKEEEKNALKISLNLFIIGFLYAIFVDPFTIEYKNMACRRLSICGALPVKPLPKKLRQKIFVLLMNGRVSRYLLLRLHCNNKI